MPTYAEDIVASLASVGCDKAFGVSGGNIYSMWRTLNASDSIDVHHFRHETGAVFAAMEYSLLTDKVVCVFTTSGPGITNAITGLQTAHTDGGRIIFIGGLTSEEENPMTPRKLQDTRPCDIQWMAGPSTSLPLSESCVITKPDDLIVFRDKLSHIATDPRGGILGLFLSSERGKTLVDPMPSQPASLHVWPNGDAASIDQQIYMYGQDVLDKLRSGDYIIWVGYGARSAAKEVRQIAEHFNTPVISTPRGKGIFPGNHPLYYGMTGLGATVDHRILDKPPKGVLVLGTRAGELSSIFIQYQWESADLIAVDLDSFEVRRNMPENLTVIQAEIGQFLEHVISLGSIPSSKGLLDRGSLYPPFEIPWEKPENLGRVHPQTVMSVVQDLAINKAGVSVISDVGNSMSWTARYIRPTKPNQFRTMLSVSAMGHGACGSVGIAMAGMPSVGIIGDGAMLMQNEVSTAVQYNAKAIWLVMNDSRYSMCHQVPKMWGDTPPPCEMPDTDFALYARAMGCPGFTATTGEELQALLSEALDRDGPTMIDVKLDPDPLAPNGARAHTLLAKGTK